MQPWFIKVLINRCINSVIIVPHRAFWKVVEVVDGLIKHWTDGDWGLCLTFWLWLGEGYKNTLVYVRERQLSDLHQSLHFLT